MNGRVETKACGVMVKVEEQEAAIQYGCMRQHSNHCNGAYRMRTDAAFPRSSHLQVTRVQALEDPRVIFLGPSQHLEEV